MDGDGRTSGGSGTTHGATKVDHPDRAPKPKLSKAERRELQEKQRAAKLAKSQSDGRSSAASGLTGAKAGQSPLSQAGAIHGKMALQVIHK